MRKKINSKQKTFKFTPPPEILDCMTYRIKVIKEAPGIGTIKTFVVEKYQNSLLGGVKAEVTFTYSNKKEVEITGDEKEVFYACIERIKLKKNKVEAEKTVQSFIKTFSTTVVGARARREGKYLLGSKGTIPRAEYSNPFALGKSGSLLNAALAQRDMTTKELADQMKEDTEQKESTTYTHTSGSRAISRDVALKYAEILKCDPVDLMFNKMTIPVWGKVNLMIPVDMEKTYSPGEIYSYTANVGDTEITIVPRDIWRSDIKAIKVDAKGTMFHNQVAFYYYKKNNDEAALNKLCIVGREVYPHPELDPNYTETEFYFGVYENIRGKSNLINPDPFVDDVESKFILKNFKPTFISPVVAMVNTDTLVDDTDKQGSIPPGEYRMEEKLRREHQVLKDQLKKQLITADKYEKQANEIHEQIAIFQKRLDEQVLKEKKLMFTEGNFPSQKFSYFGKKYTKKVS
jgi:SOS response regulatory protein OraA/RecX